jgi:superfamily II DNA or RNA helicase|tara:strand:+ start:1840 stop:3513 length:1674 start_codon:yes stop_codon:yes gene_type:complete
MKMRPYQEAAVAAVKESFNEHDLSLVVMATGLGKTVVFSHVIDKLVPQNKRVMVLAHREELLRQASDKIEKVTGEQPDMEMADYWADQPSLASFDPKRVIVSTVQTQVSGGDGLGRMARFNPEQFGLVVVDEAHHSVSKTYRRVLDHFRTNPDCKVLGVTATPDRTDEAALGQLFEDVPFDMDISDAIRDGWLVPIHARQVHVEGLDFSSVKTTAGDLNGADLDRIMNDESTLHKIAGPTIDIAGDRRTLMFSTTRAMAERLCEILNRHRTGCAEYVDGLTPRDKRRDMLRRYQDGDFQFLCNVGVATEGFDVPGIQVVTPKPTKSRSLYAQQIGRGTRPVDGLVDQWHTPEDRREAIASSSKPFMEIIDFTGVTGRHRLIHGPDVLGGRFDDDVIDVAKRMMEDSPDEAQDIEELLEAAQRRKEEEDQRSLAQQTERDRRSSVKAKVKYTTSREDALSFFSVTPSRARDWDRARPLSDKQLDVLRRQGVDVTQYSNSEMKQMLVKLFGRIRSDACSLKQSKVLQRADWYDDDVSFREASRRIDILSKNKWRKPHAV